MMIAGRGLSRMKRRAPSFHEAGEVVAGLHHAGRDAQREDDMYDTTP